jgi:hypothetical protein
MPDELEGHVLLNQADFGPTEKSMIAASAKGSLNIAALVDSMRQLSEIARTFQSLALYLLRQRAKRDFLITARRIAILKRSVGRRKRHCGILVRHR